MAFCWRCLLSTNIPYLSRSRGNVIPMIREVVKKNGYFTVRLTVRGGRGGSTPPGLTVAFVKNLTLFSYGIWFLDTQNTFYLMVKGLKNAYLMHFSSLPSRFCCSVCYYLQCSCSLSQRVKQRVKKLFFGQNLFQLLYNHKQKTNAPLRKKHKWADRKGGGGSTLTVSLTVNYSVFFWRLPLGRLKRVKKSKCKSRWHLVGMVARWRVVGELTNGGQPVAPGVTTTVRVQCTRRLFDLPQKIRRGKTGKNRTKIGGAGKEIKRR